MALRSSEAFEWDSMVDVVEVHVIEQDDIAPAAIACSSWVSVSHCIPEILLVHGVQRCVSAETPLDQPGLLTVVFHARPS